MWRIILLVTCILWGIANADPSYEKMKKHGVGSYAGSYAGSTSDGGGYTGNYNDYDDYEYAPNFAFGFGSGIVDPYAFHQQLTKQILEQNAAHQNAIASTISMGDATVTAGASNLPNGLQDYNDILQHQHAVLFDSINNQNRHHHNSKDHKDNRYAPNYSAAAASVGSKGGYQTAFISPENPAIPNISNRFSSSSPDGFKGVSVSSYSSSSDINGKKTNYRGAQTTINDNGRITTYKVES